MGNFAAKKREIAWYGTTTRKKHGGEGVGKVRR